MGAKCGLGKRTSAGTDARTPFSSGSARRTRRPGPRSSSAAPMSRRSSRLARVAVPVAIAPVVVVADDAHGTRVVRPVTGAAARSCGRSATRRRTSREPRLRSPPDRTGSRNQRTHARRRARAAPPRRRRWRRRPASSRPHQRRRGQPSSAAIAGCPKHDSAPRGVFRRSSGAGPARPGEVLADSSPNLVRSSVRHSAMPVCPRLSAVQ